MISLFEALQTREQPKSKITNKRAEIISQFLEEINKELPSKYKNKSGKWVVANKIESKRDVVRFCSNLSHIKEIEDLVYFLSVCKDYKKRHGSFSKCFYGSLKVK